MEPIDKDKERVKELTELLNRYTYEYYVLNQSSVSDGLSEDELYGVDASSRKGTGLKSIE